MPADPVIGPVFANMDPRHAAHVASFIAEVFGGGTPYTDHGGTHSGMIARHLGRALTEMQRKGGIKLMLETRCALKLGPLTSSTDDVLFVEPNSRH